MRRESWRSVREGSRWRFEGGGWRRRFGVVFGGMTGVKGRLEGVREISRVRSEVRIS